MNYTDAAARLNAHATKTEHAGETGGPCFGLELRLVGRGTGSHTRLQESFRDVLNCLEVVNRALNGDVPSETFAKSRPLDFGLVHSVAEIMREGWNLVVSRTTPNADMNGTALLLWAVSYAWGSLLAGDIDSLRDELRVESHARGFELDLGPSQLT